MIPNHMINNRFSDAIYYLIYKNKAKNKPAIAEALNIEKSKLSEIMNNRMHLEEEVILNFCQTFNISIKWIFTGSGEMLFSKPFAYQTFDILCRKMKKYPSDYICNSHDPDDIRANAYKQALLISKYYNQLREEKIDWENRNQQKYCHSYKYDSDFGWTLAAIGYWNEKTCCGADLHFINPLDAKEAWEKFRPIYINFIK